MIALLSKIGLIDSKNNGQITSSYDATTGETVTYQYDMLKRLLQGNGTTSAASWTEN